MIRIELRSDQPIYEQIVSQMKEMIIKGLLRPGDSIPSIRKLATMVQTNPNTVARAYQELEHLGLIETLIGRGTFICEVSKPRVDEEMLQRVRKRLKPPLIELRLMGQSDDEIIKEVTDIMDELKGDAYEPFSNRSF